MAHVTETRGSDAPGPSTPVEAWDMCDCGHERTHHNHPDAGQCTEIVEYHGRSEPTTCDCGQFALEAD